MRVADVPIESFSDATKQLARGILFILRGRYIITALSYSSTNRLLNAIIRQILSTLVVLRTVIKSSEFYNNI